MEVKMEPILISQYNDKFFDNLHIKYLCFTGKKFIHSLNGHKLSKNIMTLSSINIVENSHVRNPCIA